MQNIDRADRLERPAPAARAHPHSPSHPNLYVELIANQITRVVCMPRLVNAKLAVPVYTLLKAYIRIGKEQR
jgi:hypothetical protein